MAKGYWIAFYHSIMDPDALARYAALAGPAIVAGGGRFLARGMPEAVYEGGAKERCVVIEFDSVEQAVATYESADYQRAHALLEGAVKREIRIVAGS